MLNTTDHNLDEDAWFKVENFNQRAFCIDLLQADFDSKDYDDLVKAQFAKIGYLFSLQGDDFLFSKNHTIVISKAKNDWLWRGSRNRRK